jgi:hypothetical protein
MQLNIARFIWTHCIARPAEQEGKAVVTRINKRLKELRIWVCPLNEQGKFEDGTRTDVCTSFTGAETRKMLLHWDGFVNLLDVDVNCSLDSLTDRQRDLNKERKAIGQDWFNILNVLCRRCDPADPKSRLNKKTQLEELARPFVDRVLKQGGVEACNYYLHSLTHHVPDMIMTCPVDLVDAS